MIGSDIRTWIVGFEEVLAAMRWAFYQDDTMLIQIDNEETSQWCTSSNVKADTMHAKPRTPSYLRPHYVYCTPKAFAPNPSPIKELQTVNPHTSFLIKALDYVNCYIIALLSSVCEPFNTIRSVTRQNPSSNGNNSYLFWLLFDLCYLFHSSLFAYGSCCKSIPNLHPRKGYRDYQERR